MRMRSAILASIIVVLVAVGFIWRGAFAYQDHLVAFIPEGTAAYVHLNLTPTNRRIVYDTIVQLQHAYPESLGREKLGTEMGDVIRSRDIREIAIAYVPSATPPLTLLIGQRDSNRPAIIADDDLLQKDNLAQVTVIRISGKRASMGTQMNDHPASHPYTFSAWLRPNLMAIAAPNIPAASLAAMFPETMTMDGVIDHRGLVLRSDAHPWRAAPRKLFSLVRALQPGLIHIIGFPLRAFVEQIDISAMPDLTTIIPDTIDAAVNTTAEDITVRFRSLPFTPTDHTELRMLLARIWPSIEQQTLDGEHAEVAVAIPRDINIRQMGEGWWEGRHTQQEDPIFRAWHQGSEIIATTTRSFGDVFFETKPNVLISSRCDTGPDNRAFMLESLGRPQSSGFVWSVALNLAVGNMAFCVSPIEQIVEKVPSLRENSFVDSLFKIPSRFIVPR